MYAGIKFNGYQQNNLPTIIFIPGTLISTEIYEQVKIPPGFQAVYVDWMAGDKSRRVDFVAGQIAQFIQDKSFPKLILVGYSSGGVIAMLSYLNLQDRSLVSGIMLSNTGLSTAGQANSTLPDTIRTAWTDAAIENFIRRCFVKPLDEAMYNKLFNYAKQWPADVVLEPVMSLRDIELTPKAKEFACPVYIAHGKLDPVRKVFHAEALRDSIANTKLWLLDAGHSPMYEASEQYSQILNEMVETV